MDSGSRRSWSNVARWRARVAAINDAPTHMSRARVGKGAGALRAGRRSWRRGHYRCVISFRYGCFTGVVSGILMSAGQVLLYPGGAVTAGATGIGMLARTPGALVGGFLL